MVETLNVNETMLDLNESFIDLEQVRRIPYV